MAGPYVGYVPEGDLGLGLVARCDQSGIPLIGHAVKRSIVMAGGTHCGVAGRSQEAVLDLQTLPLASGVWVVDDFPKMSVQVTEVTRVDAQGRSCNSVTGAPAALALSSSASTSFRVGTI